MKIVVTVGESFVEVAANKNHQIISSRFFLPKTNLAKSIKEFVIENDIQEQLEIIFFTNSPQYILNKELGSKPAMLVTSGFENWLEMNLPLKENDFFTISPQTISSPINNNLVFGINERINSHGDVLTPLKIEDIEFIIEKLKLNNVSHVALCLLNSHINSEHEEKIFEALSSADLTVFPSYGFEIALESKTFVHSERQRWWRAFINAYTQPTFTESMNDTYDKLKELIDKPFSFQIFNKKGRVQPIDDSNVVDTLFIERGLLKKYLQNKSDQKVNKAIYFGLEEFYSLTLNDTSQQPWQSPLGTVALNTPQFKMLCIQPTNSVALGFWNFPEIQTKTIGYEPGPMCLGRSHTLCFLDLLYFEGKLGEVDIFAKLLNNKNKVRFIDTLFSESKDAIDYESLLAKELPQEVLQNGLKKLAAELALEDENYFLFCGPLAETMKRVLTPILKYKVIQLDNNPFILSHAQLEGINK